ncbi:unnamed protein product, partial [Rotaria magnacalcarata]
MPSSFIDYSKQSIIELLLLLKIFFHQLWCWAMVDIQLLNVLLILLLTAQTTKHRKDSTGLPLTMSTIKFTFLYVLRLITKTSLSPAANDNTTSSKNQTTEVAFD